MNILFDTAGHTPALAYAIDRLQQAGVPFAATPHASHLLLPVPAFSADGNLVGGTLDDLQRKLHENIIVIGGRLTHPALAPYTKIDLLENPDYVSGNAAITAHCAIKEALSRMDITFAGCPVLIVGWGRIGKCLGRLLRGLDAHVTIAARKHSDRAIAQALGYKALDIQTIDPDLYQVIFNTVPAPVLSQGTQALNIELASTTGIAGDNVIIARGLPAKDAPRSSGKLIADTVIQLL